MRYDHAALLVLLHAYREDYVNACLAEGMSEADARQGVADFEDEAVNYEGQEADAG